LNPQPQKRSEVDDRDAAPSGGGSDEESHSERLDRELIELLNELRVALPGVQVLFAFLLTIPFTQKFDSLNGMQERVFFAALMTTAAATVLLIAPTSHHRLTFRKYDKEHMLARSNRLTIAGTVLLAVAMTLVVFLIADLLFGTAMLVTVTAATAILFGWFWYLSPLSRRVRR
jgi:hypothetical protein